MGRRAVWIVLSCLVVLLMLMSSCGGKPAPTTTAAPPATSAKPAQTTTAAKTTVPATSAAPAKATPKYGGELVYAMEAAPAGFDDAYATPYDCNTLHLTNATLIVGDWAKGLSGTGERSWQVSGEPPPSTWRGWLAESWQLPEPGTIVFKLKKGLHWQKKAPLNGREVVANDVVFSLKRLFEIKGNYVYAQHKAPSSITATDNYTVVIKADPLETGPMLRTFGFTVHIIAPEIVQPTGDMKDWKVNVGDGPFILNEYISSASASFTKNPDYWDVDPLYPQNKVPYVDKVKWLIIGDASTKFAALTTGKVDIVYGGRNEGLVTLDDAKDLWKSAPQLKWTSWPTERPDFIFMRTDTKPFGDVKVRRALAMGIDYKEVADSFYSGKASILTYPVTPDIPEIYTPLDKLPASNQELFKYDPTKAKSMLSEAGYPSGFSTEIVCLEEHVPVLSIVKDYWSKIGVNLKLDVKEAGVYKTMTGKRSHTQMVYRYVVMNQPYKMNAWRADSTTNLSMINDPSMEQMYAKICEDYWNNDRNSKLFKEKVPYIIDQAWMIQMPAPERYAFWQPWVISYNGEHCIGCQSGGRYLWSAYIWLDQDAKAKGVK